MKTRKSLVTLLAVAIVTLASAVEKPKMTVHPLNADQVVISFLNNKVSNYEISINAKNGDLVYYKQSEKPAVSYQKIFDMHNLKNGDYKLNFKANGITLKSNFIVTTKKIYFDETQTNFDPYFVFDGNDLKFSYLNFKLEKFNMEIFKGNELVYKTKIGKNFPINRGFNLSKLDAGNYKVILSSFNQKFVYHFEK